MAVSTELTERQAAVLVIVKDGGTAKHIAETLSITQAGAHSHLRALKNKGYLDDKGKLTSKALTPNGASASPDISNDAPPAKPAAKPAAKRKPAAKYTASEPSTTVSTADSNGGDDDGVFALDGLVFSALREQRDALVGTIGRLGEVIAAHEARINEIEAERERHANSVTDLTNHRQKAEQALDGLPAA